MKNIGDYTMQRKLTKADKLSFETFLKTLAELPFVISESVLKGFTAIASQVRNHPLRTGFMVFALAAVATTRFARANSSTALNLSDSTIEPESNVSTHAQILAMTAIREKIAIEPRFLEKLRLDEVDREMDMMTSLVEDSSKHPLGREKTNRIFNNPSFKLMVVSDFPDDPTGGAGVGIYRNEIQQLQIRSRYKLNICDDIPTTYRHEMHHADIALLRSQGAAEQSDEHANPFTNDDEQKQIQSAISKGDARVTKEFSKLHANYLEGKLNNPAEIEKYQTYKNALNEYEPRCVSQYAKLGAKKIAAMKKKLAAGETIMHGQICVTNILEVHPGGYVLLGRHTKQVQDLNHKTASFILDTQWRMNHYEMMYSSNQGLQSKSEAFKLSLTEADAEINANKQPILECFYPELVDYHRAFRGKYAETTTLQSEPARMSRP